MSNNEDWFDHTVDEPPIWMQVLGWFALCVSIYAIIVLFFSL